MNFNNNISLNEISKLIGREFIGNKNIIITGINEIHRVKNGEIVFVDNEKYFKKALESPASVIIINKKVDVPDGKAIIISENPFDDFNKIIQYFKQEKYSNKSISDSAKIGKNTIIQPNVFIGNNVIIGDNCIIHANVTINNDSIIGNNCIINSGTVIGSDAFYYKKTPEGFKKLHSVGNVIIKNNVEIGANCTIDRGVTDSTIINDGSKLDNLIQIGHETIIGENCLIASQVGIAGCSIIEDNVTIWGQVGIRSDIKIEKNVIVLGQAGVTKNLHSNKIYMGTPAEEVREFNKKLIYLKKLPALMSKIKNKD